MKLKTIGNLIPAGAKTPITIVIVGNHGLEGGIKMLEGEMNSYLSACLNYIPPDSSQPGGWGSFSQLNRRQKREF